MALPGHVYVGLGEARFQRAANQSRGVGGVPWVLGGWCPSHAALTPTVLCREPLPFLVHWRTAPPLRTQLLTIPCRSRTRLRTGIITSHRPPRSSPCTRNSPPSWRPTPLPVHRPPLGSRPQCVVRRVGRRCGSRPCSRYFGEGGGGGQRKYFEDCRHLGNGSHTGQQSKRPQHRSTQTLGPSVCTQVHAPDSNIRVSIQTHRFKRKVLSRKGSGKGCAGQRLAPNDFGGVNEASPRNSPSKEGDSSPKPEWNRAQGTPGETSTYGNPDLRPQSQRYTAKKHRPSRGRTQMTQGPGSQIQFTWKPLQAQSAIVLMRGRAVWNGQFGPVVPLPKKLAEDAPCSAMFLPFGVAGPVCSSHWWTGPRPHSAGDRRRGRDLSVWIRRRVLPVQCLL